MFLGIMILIFVLVLLTWFNMMPIRVWLIKAKTKCYGKVTRIKIKVIKIFEPFFNLHE